MLGKNLLHLDIQKMQREITRTAEKNGPLNAEAFFKLNEAHAKNKMYQRKHLSDLARIGKMQMDCIGSKEIDDILNPEIFSKRGQSLAARTGHSLQTVIKNMVTETGK